MSSSQIEWTESTWNPVTGCDKVSSGCKFCYAERMANRLEAMGNPRYRNGFKVTCHWDKIDEPLTWRTPRKIFVNSMSDLFHPEVPDEFILKVFETMNKCPEHTFQVLTKRPERLLELDGQIKWTSNIWMGVSIENDAVGHRAMILKQSSAKLKWISFEPLIGPVENVDLEGLDWLVIGGESGPSTKIRPMEESWVMDIVNRAENLEIPVFFKQWGDKKNNPRKFDYTAHKTFNGKENPDYAKGGCILQGRVIHQYPKSE